MTRRESNHFVYRLIPPRPTFQVDMSDEESAIMNEHVNYWEAETAAGNVVVYGPVVTETGGWGLCVFTAEDLERARQVLDADPAISSGLATAELASMAIAVLPDLQGES
jgi:uncharacterized protein